MTCKQQPDHDMQCSQLNNYTNISIWHSAH